jgi:hypothetical protein
VLADPEMSLYFKEVNIDLFKEKFRYFIGYLSGGYNHWIGKSMEESHKGVPINDQ